MQRSDTKLVTPTTLRRLGKLAQGWREAGETINLSDAKDVDVLRDELTRGRFEQAAEQLIAMDSAPRDEAVSCLSRALAARLGFCKIH